MRYGMVIDLKRCFGCYGCQIICKVENGTPPGIFWSRVLYTELGKYPAVRRMPLPLLCMHCGAPACVNVCPTGASSRRPDGVVTVDTVKCIGCLNCVIACPYGARRLYLKEREYFPGQGLTPYERVAYKKHSSGVVGKCDFCLSRIERGLQPACVDSCMTKARYFGDLDDPDSEISKLIRNRGGYQLFPMRGRFEPFPGSVAALGLALGTKPDADPSVYYLPP